MNLKEKGQKGLPLDDNLVIDAHAHWITTWLPDIDEYMRMIDRVGIDKICMAVGPGDLDMVEGFQKAYPGRILIYKFYLPPVEGEDPPLGDRIDKPGYLGYKIYPDNGCPCNEEGYAPMWEAADKKKAAVLCHTWYPSLFDDPAMFMEIANSYPSAQIILGHSGGSIDGMVRSVKAANNYDNIYLELDNVAHHYKEIEYLVKNVDVSRILFGSDFSSEDFGTHLGPILLADIKEEWKKKILGLNMKDMLIKINRYC